MAGITGSQSAVRADVSNAGSADGRDDVQMLAHWISLGAAAGGFGGGLIGGVGGRLAMFFLRLTSRSSIRGLTSDDGFIIGRFDPVDTLRLIGLTAVLGSIVGLIMVAGRPFLPRRGQSLAWALAGGITGGALLIHRDGVDFNLLEPHWFAVALFVAIPAIGAGLIRWLIEKYSCFWWRRRRWTVFASIAAVPTLIAFPVAALATLIGGLWWIALRLPGARRFATLTATRIAAGVVFGLVVLLGLIDLTRDVHAIV